MPGDGLLADDQRLGHLPVGAALGDVGQDLGLAWRQPAGRLRAAAEPFEPFEVDVRLE